MGAAASAQSVEVTQSIENTFVDPGSVARATAATSPPQRTTENSYYRSFDLTTFPQVTGPFNITEIEIGIENAVMPTGAQDITINFYVDCTGGEPKLADLTLVDSVVYELFDISLFLELIPVNITVCQDATLVVEINTLDHRGETTTAIFFIGSNAFGETGPSYIMAGACGITEISTFASIGFPDVHIVMTLFGDIVPTCDDPCQASCPACACDFDPTGVPNVCDIFDFLAFQDGFVSGDPCAIDFDPTGPPGVGDIFDFLAFQNSFVNGPCP